MKKVFIWAILTAFTVNTAVTERVSADLAFLPPVGQMVSLTPAFSPPLVRGVKLYKDNPFKFDFIIDTGNFSENAEGAALKEVSKKLVGYFLAALTIPEKDIWVNLSPYEKERIVPDEFGTTEMGKELLAQDYVLKQVAASLMYPEGPTGQEFWRRVYNEAAKRLGTNNVPVDTLNKVWIVPKKAVVYENPADNSVVVLESQLKVMLDEDYTGVHRSAGKSNPSRALSKDMLRMIILPVLEKEVNRGKNFAPLRQVYDSLILAAWYRKKIKQGILAQAYIDRKKAAGIEVDDKDINDKIYEQYLQAFRKGVYNYIKEEVDPVSNEVVLRKYFSGGMQMHVSPRLEVRTGPDAAQTAARRIGAKTMLVTVGLMAAISAGQLLGAGGAEAATLRVESPTDVVAGVEDKRPRDTLSQIIEQAGIKLGKRMSYSQIKTLIDTPGAVEVRDAKGNLVEHLNPDLIYPKQSIRLNFNLTSPVGAAAQAVGQGATPPPLNTVVEVPVQKKVSTVAAAFADSPEIRHIRKILGAERTVDLNKIIAAGGVTIKDAHGAAVASAKTDRIFAGQSAVFDLGRFTDGIQQALAAGHTPQIRQPLSGDAGKLQVSLQSQALAAAAAAGALPVGEGPLPLPPPPPPGTDDPMFPRGGSGAAIGGPPLPASPSAPSIIAPFDDSRGVKVTSPVGWRANPTPEDGGEDLEYHNGTDYGMPKLTPIRAPATGKVKKVGYDDVSGRYIITTAMIDGVPHELLLAHLDSIDPKLKEGVPVVQGQNIAKSGDTGRHTGPHLYFEVRKGKDREVVDYEKYRSQLARARIPVVVPLAPLAVKFPQIGSFMQAVESAWATAAQQADPANSLMPAPLVQAVRGSPALHDLINPALAEMSRVRLKELATARQPLIQLMQGHTINYDGTEMRIKMDETARRNFTVVQDKLYFGDNRAVSVIGSIERGNLHAHKRTIATEAELRKFLYDEGTEVTAKSLPLGVEPIDLADIRNDQKFRPIAPWEVIKYEREGRPFITYIKYKDAAGAQQEGILWGGEEAAKAKQALMQSALKDVKIKDALVRVLGITDPNEQRRVLAEPGNAALFAGAQVPAQGLLTTARVIPDGWGNIQTVDRFITEGEIVKTQISAPFPREALMHRNADGSSRELEYIPSKAGVFIQFAEISPAKARLLQDAEDGRQYLNQYFPETIEDAMQKPRFFLGPNQISQQITQNELAKYMAEREREAVSKSLALERNRLKLTVALDLVTLGMSAAGLPGGGIVQMAGHLAFDAVNEVKDTLPGPIDDARKDELVGWTLYSLQNPSQTITLEDWLKGRGNNPQFAQWTQKGKVFRTSAFSERQIAEVDSFLRSRMHEAQVGKFMGVVAQVIPLLGQTLGQFSNVNLDGLGKVLRQPILAWDGSSINLVQSASLILRGKPLDFVNISDMIKGGVKPSALLPFLGLSLDVRSIFNAATDDPLNLPFRNAPRNLRLNISLPLLPLSQIWKIDNLENQEKLYADDTIEGLIVEDGLFKTKTYGYTYEDLKQLNAVPGEATITTAKVSDGTNEFKVPVYVKYDQDKGKKTVIILKANAIQHMIDDLKKDLKRQVDYERSRETGGISEQVSADSGTYEQNRPTHLFVSYSQAGPIPYTLGMSVDQFKMALRAIASNDKDIAKGILSYYYRHMKVNTRLGETYAGTPESVNAETGQVPDVTSRAATAMQGLSLLRFREAYPAEKMDDRDELGAAQQMNTALTNVHKALLKDTMDGKIENGETAALMFAFFDRYGDAKTANYILRGAVEGLWDPNAWLLRYKSAKPGFTAQGTLLWLRVLGPVRFAQTFLGGADKTDGLINVTRAIHHVFGRDGDKSSGLLDAVDAQMRPAGRPMVGFVSETASLVSVLTQILNAPLPNPLSPEQRQEIQDGIRYYSANLNSMKSRRGATSIAETNRVGEPVPSGKGSFTSVGKKALGALMDVETMINADLLGPGRLTGLAALPRVDRVVADAQVVPADRTERERVQRSAQQLAQAQKAGKAGTDGEAIDYIDPTNGQQIVKRLKPGTIQQQVFLPSQAEIQEYVTMIERQLRNALRYGQALRGEGEFSSGGVVIKKIGPGNTVGGSAVVGGQEILGSAHMAKVMERIRRLPSLQQHKIDRQRYSNFVMDLNMDGLNGTYVVSFIFPQGKGAAITLTNPDNGDRIVEVYNGDGVETMTIGPDLVTIHEYNALNVQARGKTFGNTLNHAKEIANPKAYAAKLMDMVQRGQLPLQGLSFTTAYRHVTATSDQDRLSEKVFVDLRDGTVQNNVYSVHPGPIQVITENFVTDNRYNVYGRPLASEVHDNGTTRHGQLTDRELVTRLMHPILGMLRYTDETNIRDTDRDLSRVKWSLTTHRHDVVHGTDELIATDGQGRVIGSQFEDLVNTLEGDGTQLKYTTMNFYSKDFFGGRVPVVTAKINTATGKVIQVGNAQDFNPLNQVSVVKETNTRNGEEVANTIEPVFGQVTQSKKQDHMGRTVVTTNQYGYDQVNMMGATMINGKLAMNTKGIYSREARAWRQDQVRWNYHGGTQFIHAYGTLLLTARGHLLAQDTIYPQNEYTVNGQHYTLDNRRYIPRYDRADNITHISEGILRDGRYTEEQYTDFSNYGDFFAAQNSASTRWINGKAVPDDTGRLLTTPEKYWSGGMTLSFALNSRIYTEDFQRVETRDRDGNVLAKGEQAIAPNGTVAAERWLQFDPRSYDVQYAARNAQTVLLQPGREPMVLATSSDATTEEEARLGLTNTEIDNKFNGLLTRELKDALGRVMANGIGHRDSTGQYVGDRNTVSYDYNQLRIARFSFTDSMVGGHWRRFTTSKLLSTEEEVVALGSIRVEVNNNFMGNEWHPVVYQEEKTGRGNVTNRRKGNRTSSGFDVTRDISSRFIGIPGLMDVPVKTSTMMVVDGEEIMLSDESHLLTAHGVDITEDNVYTVPADDIFNSVKKVRYAGTSLHHVIGYTATETQAYQATRNGLGNVEIMEFGNRSENGQWDPNRRLYALHGLLKNVDIADTTITTQATAAGEEIRSYSNNTHIIDGGRAYSTLLVYRTQEGKDLPGVSLSGDIFINLGILEQHVEKNNHILPLGHVIQTSTEIKDYDGRVVAKMAGYPAIDPVRGFGVGTPGFVAFNEYNDKLVSQPFAVKTITYPWIDGMGEPMPTTTIAPLTNYLAEHRQPPLAELTGLRFKGGAARYDVQDKREVGLKELSLHLDGTKDSELYYGVEDPKVMRVYYGDAEQPVYSEEEGTRRPYAVYKSILFKHGGTHYALLDEFKYPQRKAEGAPLAIDGVKPYRSTLSHNGTILRITGGYAVRTTPYSSVISTDDMLGNSAAGKLAGWVLPSPEAQKVMDYGHEHAKDADVAVSQADQRTDAITFGHKTWLDKANEAVVTFGYISAAVLTGFALMFGIRVLGYMVTALRTRGKLNANEAQVQNFEDMGFTDAQAKAILEERFRGGAFVSFAEFKSRLETQLLYTHKLSERWLRRTMARIRFNTAMWHMSKFKYSETAADVFSKDDVADLSSKNSVVEFMQQLGQIYQVSPDQRASFEGAMRMFSAFLTAGDLKALVASSQFQALVGRYSKKRAVEVILRLLYDKARDKQEFKDAVRNRLETIIKATGMDTEFPEQIFALKDAFLRNIELARLLPEGLQFHDFDVESDLVLYSFDDLRQKPDAERLVRSNLVSLEKLFIYQVVFQRAMMGLAGQGRAEDYLWVKYIYPNMKDMTALQNADILPKIKAFRLVFQTLLKKELARLNENRDPKGKTQYFQNVINEEVYNDAFRYLIGQKDPMLSDASWILPQSVQDKVKPLRERFESILVDEINNMTSAAAAQANETVEKEEKDKGSRLTDEERAKRLKELQPNALRSQIEAIAGELKPVILAFVGAVDKEIGMPVVKGRLAYWKLSVLPMLKMITDGKMRKRIFSKGGVYSQTAHDVVRRWNNLAVIGTVTGLFTYLTFNAISLMPFMAVSSWIMLPWAPLAGVAALLASSWGLSLLKWRMVKSFDKKAEALKDADAKAKALKAFNRKLKWMYSAQVLLTLGAIGIAPLLNLPAQMLMIPPVASWVIYFIPALIFADTWRLTFYAVNYFLGGLAEQSYYVTNNVYEISNNGRTKPIIGRLMALFTDTHPAQGSLYRTQGQERLDSFARGVVQEMTGQADGYYFADEFSTDGKTKLTEKLLALAKELTDQKGVIVKEKAEELNKELQAFVLKLAKPVEVKDENGKVYRQRRFRMNALERFMIAIGGQEKAGLQEVIDYINHNYRLDAGSKPMTEDHVIPLTGAIIGYGEDWYFSDDELLKPNPPINGETEEFTHRLGMLAAYKTELFLLMVNRLTKSGSMERRELLKMIDDPIYVPVGKDDVRLMIEKLTKLEDREREELLNILNVPTYVPQQKDELRNKISELTAPGSLERQVLLAMIDDPKYVPADNKNIRQWEIWPEIQEWANIQLPTGYANAISQQRAIGRLYEHYGRIFEAPDAEAFARDRFRVIDRNLGAVDALNKVLGGNLREMVDVLIETDYKSTYIVREDGSVRGIRDPYVLVNKNAKDTTERYSRITMRKMLDGITRPENRIFPVRILGGGLDKDILMAENYNGSKWNQKTAILPFLIGPVLLNLDADHRSNYADIEMIANHLLEFHYNPGLATSTPVIKHTLSKGLGVFGNILPVSENAFYYHAQQGKELFGGLTAYGKLFERVSALRRSEGITDSYVAEDALTAMNYQRFGYVSGRAGAVKIRKGWPFSHINALNPERKWSYDSVESVTGRTALKLMVSPLVPWAYLMNNLWLDGFGFYFKKPGIIKYIRWLLLFYLAFDWNLFSGIPMAMWIGSLGLSQAISHGLFFYKMYDESRGPVKGVVSGIEHIVTKMYVKFVHNIFVFEETIAELASNRRGKFIPTASKGANQMRVLNKEMLYVRSHYAIKSAAVMALATLTLVGVSPDKVLYWAPTLLMGFAGVAAPFVLDPVRTKHRVKDNLSNAGGALSAFWWGLRDRFAGLDYWIGAVWFGRRAEKNVQRKVLELVEAHLGMPYAELLKADAGVQKAGWTAAFGVEAGEFGKELTEILYLYLQEPSLYEQMYGRVPVTVVTRLLDLLQKEEDKKVERNALAWVEAIMGISYAELLKKDALDQEQKWKEAFGDEFWESAKELMERLYAPKPSLGEQIYGRTRVVGQLLDLLQHVDPKNGMNAAAFPPVNYGSKPQVANSLPESLKIYRDDLTHRKEVVKKHLEVLESVDTYAKTIAEVRKQQLKTVDDILSDTNKLTLQRLDQVDWLLTQLSWMPMNIERKTPTAVLNGIGRSVFSIIGLEALLQAFIMYVFAPLVVIPERFLFHKRIKQDVAKAQQGPPPLNPATMDRVVPADAAMTADAAQSGPPISRDVVRRIGVMLSNTFRVPFAHVLQDGMRRAVLFPAPRAPGSQVSRDLSSAASKAAKPVRPGGIDMGKTDVEVRTTPGAVEAGAAVDSAMLQMVLQSDGLKPIIYDIKMMTPSMIHSFVDAN